MRLLDKVFLIFLFKISLFSSCILTPPDVGFVFSGVKHSQVGLCSQISFSTSGGICYQYVLVEEIGGNCYYDKNTYQSVGTIPPDSALDTDDNIFKPDLNHNGIPDSKETPPADDNNSSTGTGGDGNTSIPGGGSSTGYGQGFDEGVVNGNGFLDDFCNNLQREYSAICQRQGLFLDYFSCNDSTGRNNYTCASTNPDTPSTSLGSSSSSDVISAINSLAATTINQTANTAANLASLNSSLSQITTLLGGTDGTGGVYRSFTTKYTKGDGTEGDAGADTIAQLVAINEKLGSSPDGSDSSPNTSSSDTTIGELSSFIDGFAGEFTTMLDDATSIKTEFDTLKSQLSGNDINKNINLTASSGSCDIGFTLMGHTFRPLASLPGILSPYSSIFSILVYISIMFFNFRLVFNRGL